MQEQRNQCPRRTGAYRAQLRDCKTTTDRAKVEVMAVGDTFSDEVWEEILERLCDGEMLRAICRTEGFPSHNCVHQKKHNDTEFGLRFARARKAGYRAILEDTIEIADDSSGDETEDETGRRRINSEFVQRSKLRVDTRFKYLAILDADYSPKRPSDDEDQETPSFSVNIGIVDARKTPDGEPDS